MEAFVQSSDRERSNTNTNVTLHTPAETSFIVVFKLEQLMIEANPLPPPPHSERDASCFDLC